MKYCPYCGAELLEDVASFCVECGKSIPVREVPIQKSSAKPKKKPAQKKKKKVQPPRDNEEPKEHIRGDGYDGYYDDIIPDDAGETRQALDKAVIKKITLLIIGLLVVVAACVAMMYLL